MPVTWPGFQPHWRVGTTSYLVEVVNPGRHPNGVARATLDGAAVSSTAVPLIDDGRAHTLAVELGPSR